MKSNNVPLLLVILLLLTNCVSSSTTTSSPTPTLVSLAVAPTNPSISVGMTEQFTVLGTFSNSSIKDMTASVTWNSAAPSVASISNTSGFNGLATSLSTGTTSITAVLGNITSNSVTLTVTARTLVSIEIMPASVSIPTGTTQQFIATGTYSDSFNQDLTASATWTSSATDVAIISTTGLATAVSTATTATTLIIARSGNVSSSAILTVTGGPAAVASNVLPITVNGSLCSPNTSAGYLNKPCVSVTVCTPGTATCQTVTDILMDTGSSGLRIFKQALSVSLTQVMSSSPAGSLTNCAQFADGSADWGPVQLADVVLGSEPAVRVPIQVIDATFGTIPALCSTIPDLSPVAAGFNGILGVGVFPQDCGPTCVSSATVIYNSCNGTVCSSVTAPLSNQVTNPVVSLPTDSNGVIVQLPGVSSSGSPSVNGILVLGIGTHTNNTPPANVTTYNANSFGEIGTTFNGTVYPRSIVDSGSNGLFFTSASGQLPLCNSTTSPWFCPSSVVTLSATIMGASGTPSNAVFFQVGNFDSLTNSSNQAFSDIGGFTSNFFDWGLPFYFGRNIYVGVYGQRSSLGIGPYIAY